MNKLWILVFAVFLLLAAIIYKRGHWENSAYALKKTIGKVEALDVFSLQYDGKNLLLETRDAEAIQEFLGAIEFERVSLTKLICIKSPGVLEFVTTGVTTQRMQWLEFGWGYLRADNDLLSGDVQLTEASSQRLADWLARQGIEAPPRGAEQGVGGVERRGRRGVRSRH